MPARLCAHTLQQRSSLWPIGLCDIEQRGIRNVNRFRCAIDVTAIYIFFCVLCEDCILIVVCFFCNIVAGLVDVNEEHSLL